MHCTKNLSVVTSLQSWELQKRSFDVLNIATTPWWFRALCIPTCSYFIYYCFLPSALASPSLLLKVPNDKRTRTYFGFITKKGHWGPRMIEGARASHIKNGKVLFFKTLSQNYFEFSLTGGNYLIKYKNFRAKWKL